MKIIEVSNIKELFKLGNSKICDFFGLPNTTPIVSGYAGYAYNKDIYPPIIINIIANSINVLCKKDADYFVSRNPNNSMPSSLIINHKDYYSYYYDLPPINMIEYRDKYISKIIGYSFIEGFSKMILARECYYLNGVLHRKNGPAVKIFYFDNDYKKFRVIMEYYLNGKSYTFDGYFSRLKERLTSCY